MNITIAPLQSLAQAAGVAELFLQVYGDGYPVALYYDAQRLLEVNREGSTLSQVACDQSGRVVGHCAAYPSAPNPRLLELGAGLVHPDTRGMGTIAELVRGLVARSREESLADWLFAEAVCNHTTTQRTVHREGFVDTALEVDLMPASAYTREASAVGRVSTLLSFLPISDSAAEVYLPEVYSREIQELYSALGIERTFREATSLLAPPVSGEVGRWRNEAADLLRLTVRSIGTELESCLTLSATVLQISLPLDGPQVGWAVQRARSAGFVLSGLLPRRADSDHMLLQRISGPTEWDRNALESVRAKTMLQRVRGEALAP